ncbi:hypothetical protein PSEUBRA_005545 [Kalmanozyma brasiliensis GHG001]|uniref:Uncharacterized protein n=1 Tax=Kalmanozyma brasiliensis (strain GHG001) TaxID=1365824 RepID=V5E4Y5_KALBG|nr:uncharacterized protein PSEUBRA_005545 [Kalmanozyma brasiliensis GHG001]EST05276.1 hypothetical protein PSEUBRA_005545 [Kalmanozyma brasiliensis GHG001]
MPVPDSTSTAPAGSQSSQLGTNAGDLSLSQSISASASDLKRPISPEGVNDESQTLSRTKTAKAHYGKAARAFLAKDLLTALLQSQQAVDLLLSPSQLGHSLTASALLKDADLDVQKLVEKVAILRLTVFTQVYTDKQVSATLNEKLAQTRQQSSSDAAVVDRILLLLSKQPQSLISHLWFEALRLCTQTSGEADAPSLDPTPETIHLAIELPASVVSSAVLAALRLDAVEPSARTGTNAARLIAEWYLASFSSAFGAAPPTPKAAAAYEKIVGLYSLHVLASRLGEWEYAREFVGYSSLAESIKFGLLEQINEAQTHLTGQSEREQEAIANAQKSYAQEKAKREAEEKQAKEAAAAAAASGKGSNKVGGKARDLAAGIGNFLTGKKETDAETMSSSTAGSKTSASSRSSSRGTRDSPSGSSGSGSDGGSRSHRQRSQSPAYFSPRAGAAESGSSSSTSPAISPGSTRSVESGSKQAASSAVKEEKKAERRSVRRSSSSRSSDIDGGNESSTSAASNHSRRSTRSNGGEAATKEPRLKDDTGYASTRAHLSRYMEGHHHSTTGPGESSSSSSQKKGSPRDVTSNNSILSTITSMFDFRKANQTRTMLMSAIVMMLVFYRVARRPPAQGAATKASPRRNAAARDARSKLVGKNGSGGGGVLGFNWLLLVYRKVMDTIKMGTQVTYL